MEQVASLPECKVILDRIRTELPVGLYFHDITHTRDVCEAAWNIARLENIGERDIFLLLVACVHHDVGYLETRAGHEERSRDIAISNLRTHGYSEDDIHVVCELIMATRIPQKPVTLLQEIICDADLDYLGRDDFFQLSHQLYQEFLEAGLVADWNAWHTLQLDFVSSHRFFTPTSLRERQEKQDENLRQLLLHPRP